MVFFQKKSKSPPPGTTPYKDFSWKLKVSNHRAPTQGKNRENQSLRHRAPHTGGKNVKKWKSTPQGPQTQGKLKKTKVSTTGPLQTQGKKHEKWKSPPQGLTHTRIFGENSKSPQHSSPTSGTKKRCVDSVQCCWNFWPTIQAIFCRIFKANSTYRQFKQENVYSSTPYVFDWKTVEGPVLSLNLPFWAK